MHLTRHLLAPLALVLAAPAAAQDEPARILVFSHSTGYRHASIEAGVAAISDLGERIGMEVVASADPAVFDGDGLAGFDAIVLVSTTTDPKDPASEWWVGDRRTAFENFVHAGGGVVGVHAAGDSHYNWPWYGRLIGGRFARHPRGTPEGEVTVTDPAHPANAGVTGPQRRADEWYYYDDYNPTMDLLATVDPASIGEADVNPNPVAWAHEFEGGRVFYTAMGHTDESFAEPWFMQHLESGLRWAVED